MRIKSILFSAAVLIVAYGIYRHFHSSSTYAAASDLADNPVYKAWAACKTGSTVTYKITSGDKESTSTRTLLEVLPAMVIFSDHTVRPDGADDATHVAMARVNRKNLGLPSSEDVIFARIETSTPSPDTVQIQGNSVPATLHTFDTWIFDPENKSTYKSWTYEDFPGGVLKIEGKSLRWELVDFKKADADVPRPASDFDDSTPKGLLRLLDRHGLEKGRDFIASLYDAPTPSAQSYADARAAFEFALLALDNAARTRFGESTNVTEAIARLANHHHSRAYIEIGDVVIQDNKAALVYDLDQSVRMVKINGHWRFPAFEGDEEIKPEEITSELEGLRMFTTVLGQFTKDLQAGKYKSEEAFRTAVMKKQEDIAPENL
jgi:hypothetical protein